MKLLVLFLLFSLTSAAFGKFKIASYNIRNFDYDDRSGVSTNKEHLYRTLYSMDADIIAVQEINRAEKFKAFIQRKFTKKYEVVLSQCGGAHGQKLGFVYDTNKFKLIEFKEDLRVSNPNLHHQSRTSCHSGSRPLAIGKFKMLDSLEEIIAISVHLKSGGSPSSISKRFKQLNIITKVVNHYRNLGYKNFMIMGDFNSTEYIFKGRNYKQFKNVVQNMGLVDLAKDIKCTSYWWGGVQDGKEYPSILDHILVSPALIQSRKTPQAHAMTHCQKLKCNATWEDGLGTSFNEVSDHCPLVSDLE